ncbi:uncharacterized protein LOC131685530 [Topomyia yanbarensis]|uniref:uncharacterized protein LOC131685530 n=1 Tax=Topomyia yanbarensis TaxID=2498891 RepID=UPI00273C23BF|nr:uncharacterized protein LOC131685530 [Topomyia yanbarensis]
MLTNAKDFVFLLLLLLLAAQRARSLNCYRCKSTFSWTHCGQNAIVEVCAKEYPSEDRYQCVSNRMNLTMPLLELNFYATGCGLLGQDGARKLFERLSWKHSHANVTVEEWPSCDHDLCNSVADFDATFEPPARIVSTVGSATRFEPRLVLLGIIMFAVRMVMA